MSLLKLIVLGGGGVFAKLALVDCNILLKLFELLAKFLGPASEEGMLFTELSFLMAKLG